MVFARDLTEQYGSVPSEDEYIRLFLLGDIDKVVTLATASPKEVYLHEAIYFNRLSLNQTLLPKLVDKCR